MIKVFIFHILKDLVHLEVLDPTIEIHSEHRDLQLQLQLIKVCEDQKILCLYAGFCLLLYDH